MGVTDYGTSDTPTATSTYAVCYDVRDYATFATAITALGTTNATLLIPTAQAVASDITVPTNVELWFQPGGELDVATGYSVTINGHIIAGVYQIFSCSGTGYVSIGTNACQYVYPEWWGGGTGATAAVNSAAIQAAINKGVSTTTAKASGITEGPITKFGTGTYSYDTTLYLPTRCQIEGTVGLQSVLSYTGTGTGAEANGSTRTYTQRISNIYLTSDTGTVGFDLQGVSSAVFENVNVAGFSTYQFSISTAAGAGYICYNRFTNCDASGGDSSLGTSWYLEGDVCNANVFIGCRARRYADAGGVGVYIKNCHDNTFLGCQIENDSSAAAYGVNIEADADGQASTNRFIACRFEGKGADFVIGVGTHPEYVQYTYSIGNFYQDTAVLDDNGTGTVTS